MTARHRAFGAAVDMLADGFHADYAAEDPACKMAEEVSQHLRYFGLTDDEIRRARRVACIEAVSRVASFDTELERLTNND